MWPFLLVSPIACVGLLCQNEFFLDEQELARRFESTLPIFPGEIIMVKQEVRSTLSPVSLLRFFELFLAL